MNILYHIEKNGNFGDDINEWLWDMVLPNWRELDKTVTIIGLGTLLSDKRFTDTSDTTHVVLGSGTGYGRVPDSALTRNWDIRFVRGPNTAAALGVGAEKAITDPAVLISDLDEFRDIPKSDRTVFVPHHKTISRHDWASACEKAGLDYVSPKGDAKTVIRKIAAAQRVIAESLHAAIIADTFRVPWVPVKIGKQFNKFKWDDWMQSMNLNHEIKPMFPRIDHVSNSVPTRRLKHARLRARVLAEGVCLQAALKRHAFDEKHVLSDIDTLMHRKHQMWRILSDVARDYDRS